MLYLKLNNWTIENHLMCEKVCKYGRLNNIEFILNRDEISRNLRVMDCGKDRTQSKNRVAMLEEDIFIPLRKK